MTVVVLLNRALHNSLVSFGRKGGEEEGQRPHDIPLFMFPLPWRCDHSSARSTQPLLVLSRRQFLWKASLQASFLGLSEAPNSLPGAFSLECVQGFVFRYLLSLQWSSTPGLHLLNPTNFSGIIPSNSFPSIYTAITLLLERIQLQHFLTVPLLSPLPPMIDVLHIVAVTIF